MSTTIKKRQIIKVSGVNDQEIVHPETQANQVLFTGTNNVSSPKTINETECANVDAAIDELITALGQAGKVDDVKVDGTSVVTNKVANIPLSTAITTAINGLDSSVTADSGYALASVTETNGKLSAKTQVKIPNTASEVGLGSVTNNKQIKAFTSTPTADKIVITKSSDSELNVSSYSVNDIVEIAEGKTASYVTSGTQMSALKVQTASVTVSSFKDIDGTTIPITNFKIGDVILVTDTDYPDRWVSAKTLNPQSITLSKMETSKVDIEPKLDKLTTSGNHVYSHNGSTQSEIVVDSSITSSSNGIPSSSAVTSYAIKKPSTYANNKIMAFDSNGDAKASSLEDTGSGFKIGSGFQIGVSTSGVDVTLTNPISFGQTIKAKSNIIPQRTSIETIDIGESDNKFSNVYATNVDATNVDATNVWATSIKKNGEEVLTQNQYISVSGDATGNGRTSITLTLASIMPNVDTNGQYSAVKVDTKGRVTAVGKAIEWGTTTSSTPSTDLMEGGIFMALQG